MKHALRYYEFLSVQPTIFGTEEQDIFRISASNSGISVTVYQQGNTKRNKASYQRRFYPGETKKIFIRGLGGNDRFIVDQGVSSYIKLYLEGGEGNDEYSVQGKIKTRIDDVNKSTSKPVLAQK